MRERTGRAQKVKEKKRRKAREQAVQNEDGKASGDREHRRREKRKDPANGEGERGWIKESWARWKIECDKSSEDYGTQTGRERS